MFQQRIFSKGRPGEAEITVYRNVERIPKFVFKNPWSDRLIQAHRDFRLAGTTLEIYLTFDLSRKCQNLLSA
jgi:hypothetical protein